MIDYQKRWLVENGQRNVTLEGAPASVNGWGHGKASICAYFAGVWSADWKTVERVLIDGDRKFIADDVTLESWDDWKGLRGWRVPNALRYHKIPEAQAEPPEDAA